MVELYKNTLPSTLLTRSYYLKLILMHLHFIAYLFEITIQFTYLNNNNYKMLLFTIIFAYALYSVTPVGDNRLVKCFRYFIWATILINTNWLAFFIWPIVYFLVVSLNGYVFALIVSICLYPSSNCELEEMLYMPLSPLLEKYYSLPKFALFQQSGKKRKKMKRNIVPLLKDKEKDKNRCQNVQRARDKKYVLEEQSGFNYDALDKYARELTLLETLRRILLSSNDKSGIIAGLVMYAQAHSNNSLLNHFFSLSAPGIDREGINTFINTLHEQSGVSDTFWITQLRACLTDWKRHKHSKIARNFLNLLNYVVSVGLCDKAKLTFKIGNLTLFSPIVVKRQLNAVELTELVTETALGFLEGGWRVFCNKSISSFFMEEDLFVEFEQAYNDIRDIHGYSLSGNLRKFANIDENEYELKLDAAIVTGDKMLKKLGNESSFERKFVSDRLDKIRDYRAEFVQIRTKGGLRVAPFGVSLFGDSAVGKSTLNQLTYEAIGQYNNIDTTAERVATWSDNDKFASNIRASTNVIIFDDFGNTSPNFMDFSPCYRLIQCVNNALFTAPMAEANLKGKVGLHPHIVTITTNVEYLLANVYSEKPESVLRRFYHVKVEIKDQFMKDGKLDETKVFNTFGYIKKPDIWKLSVRSCVVTTLVATGSSKRNYGLEPIMFEGKKMVDVDVTTYLRWVQNASKKHYQQQRELVETMRKEAPKVCYLCGYYGCNCSIPIENTEIPLFVEEDIMEEHVGVRRSGIRFIVYIAYLFLCYVYGVWVGTVFNWYFSFMRGILNNDHVEELPRFTSIFINFLPNIDRSLRNWYNFVRRAVTMSRAEYIQMTNESLLQLQHFYNTHWLFDFIIYLPENYAHSHWMMIVLIFHRRMEIAARKRLIISLIVAQYVFGLVLLYQTKYLRAIIAMLFCNYLIAVMLLAERERIQQELLQRRYVAPAIVIWLREHYVAVFGAFMSSVYLALKIYRASQVLHTQGNLQPASFSDIVERDKETNPWAELVISPLPMSTSSKTTTSEDLIGVVSRNIVNVESDRYIVKGFFLTSNVLVVPFHYLTIHRKNGYVGDIKVKCYRTDRSKVGGNFRETLSEEYSYRIPDTDFIAFYSPSSGSSTNIVKFLPLSAPTTTDARFVVKEEDCSINVSPILYEAQKVEHTSMAFQGGRYKLPFETYNGLCMSPIVSVGKGSTIVGFHLCGKSTIGGAGFISQSQAELAILSLNNRDGCIVNSANGIFPKEQYGFQVITDPDIHKKSAARFVTPDNSLEVYGATSGMATPTSNVVETVISPFVSEIMGVPQQWGPPKIYGKGVYPFQAALETLSHPSLSLGSIVRPSVLCYRSVFEKIKKRIPELFHEAKPLSEVETVCGIDGRRFIDAMNMKTSPGWPLTGRKDKWLVELDPDLYPHISRPRTFVPKIWEEVNRCCEIMRAGERPYFIWKACLKDEPTKLTKDKVRVFQSAPIALQLIIRMYFLPIVRIIQCNPLESECLVGANAEGPEWEQLNYFMTSKGANILAGDYSKYDQRMPAQLVIAAFDVLIWIAQTLCDYPMSSILIMRGVVGEVAFPLMAYNGDLLQLFGSNPSGQNLTVIINSIANSLLMRSCFYTIYKEEIPKLSFRDYCAMATYGDDVKGSVSDCKYKFNHISYAEFLAEFDIVFTMPDKESVATSYMSTEDADFLKRTNKYHEDLRINVGILSESSIFKRLHSHLLSKELSLNMQSAVNIDSSLHDWFYYGRETFELRKAQLERVASKAGISHLCRGFHISYDQRIIRWNQKYRGVASNHDLDISTLSSESILDLGYSMEEDIPISEDIFVFDNGLKSDTL